MLPNAKIIDVRREPVACCFSNLKQLFARGQEFTYSIEDIARHYRTYLELMRHWDAVLPGQILRVQYEDVVEDLAGNVRRILEHCGLKFEPACVEFYRQNVASARPAQSRRGKLFSAMGSLSGGTTRDGSARSRTTLAMHSCDTLNRLAACRCERDQGYADDDEGHHTPHFSICNHIPHGLSAHDHGMR